MGEGEVNAYCSILWPELESTFTSGSDDDRHRYKSLKPYVACCVNEGVRVVGKGEGWVLRVPVGDPSVVQHGSPWFSFVSADWLCG